MKKLRTRLDVSPTPEQEQIIFGSLLGDGFLHHPNRGGHNMSSALKMTHSGKQREYLEWKHSILSNFAYPIHSFSRKEKRGGSWAASNGSEVVYFNCASHPYFTDLWERWYINGHRIFSLDNVQNLNWLGLAVWYMDDGTYGFSKGSPYGFFCTEGFEADAQPVIKDFLLNKFGLPCSVVATGHGKTKIRILAAGIRILQEKIDQYVIPSLKYKLGY